MLGDFNVNRQAFSPSEGLTGMSGQTLFGKVVRRLDAGHEKGHTITP